jgi:hypothetical protein
MWISAVRCAVKPAEEKKGRRLAIGRPALVRFVVTIAITTSNYFAAVLRANKIEKYPAVNAT